MKILNNKLILLRTYGGSLVLNSGLTFKCSQVTHLVSVLVFY